MKNRHLRVGTVHTYPDAIEVKYSPIEVLGLMLSDLLIEHQIAWPDGLREAWEKADRHYSAEKTNLAEWDINKLITEYGLTVVDGDIYAFAWAVQHVSRTKQL